MRSQFLSDRWTLWLVPAAALVIGIGLGVWISSFRQIRIWAACRDLQETLDNPRRRPNGGWDESLIDPNRSLEVLRELGAEADARELLSRSLNSRNTLTRWSALLLIPDLKEHAFPLVPRLEQIAADSSRPKQEREDARGMVKCIREQLLRNFKMTDGDEVRKPRVSTGAGGVRH